MDRTGDLLRIGGLPVHPLIVHAVVVLLPLAAVCAAAVAIWSPWRRRFGWPVLILTLLAVGAVPIAQQTGEQLFDALTATGVDSATLTQHTTLGSRLLPLAIGFGVTVIALLGAGRLADRERAAENGGGVDLSVGGGQRTVSRAWRRISVVTSVLVVVAAAGSITLVVLIGDSGASAVWQGIPG